MILCKCKINNYIQSLSVCLFSLSLSLSLSLMRTRVFFLLICLPYKMIDAIHQWNAVFDNKQPLLYPISIWRMNWRMTILPGTREHEMKNIITLKLNTKSFVTVSHMHMQIVRSMEIIYNTERQNASIEIKYNVDRKKSVNLILWNNAKEIKFEETSFVARVHTLLNLVGKLINF